MATDRHEVVLEANIKGFKQKMKEAQDISKETSKKIQENNKFGVWKDGVLTLSNGMRYVKKETSKKIQENNKFGVWKDGVLTLSNGMRYVKKETAEANQELTETKTISKKIGGDVSKAFDKGLKSIKRLTIGFLGARSAFMLFRKYLGEYQRQNEEFAQKMQTITNIIVTTLAPAFEMFANILQYTVLGLARIIELLTGANIISKAFDTTLKNASKSAKSLNDNLSGLDEISNISDSSNMSTGIQSSVSAIADFKSKLDEVDDWLNKTKLKSFFEKLAPILKDAFDWMVGHPLSTFGIIGAIGLLNLTLPAVLGIAGGTVGLFGLATALTIIAGISISGIIEQVQQLYDISASNQRTIQNSIDMLDEVIEKSEEWTQSLTGEKAQKTFNNIDYLATQTFDDIEQKINDIQKFKGMGIESIFYRANYESDKKLLDGYVESLMAYIEIEEDLYEQGKLTNEQRKQYEKTIDRAREKLEGLVNKGFYKVSDKYIDELEKINQKQINLKVNVDANTTTMQTKISNALSNAFSSLTKNKTISTLLGKLLPSYDVGTAYVPRDQLAIVHEGERIIPKQYNNADYLGQMGNSETNALLIELNRNVLEFAKRPSVISVNGRELAKATYSDYQEEGSRRGTSTSVRRV